jgi:hypothetical protein
MTRRFTEMGFAPWRARGPVFRAHLAALVAFALLLPVAALASAPSISVGSYRAKAADGAVFDIIVAQTQCRNPQNNGPLALRLCISLPSTPTVEETCAGGTTMQGYFENFATPVQLPNSGKLTQHTESYEGTSVVGRSTFSVTIKPHGTAAGYIEQSGTETNAAGQNVTCTTSKVPFTARRS